MEENILVVTVGTNPLPAYVAVKYFMEYLPKTEREREYDHILLICSEENNNQKGTNQYAEKLREILKIKDKCDIVSLSDVSDPEKIYEDLENFISNREIYSKKKVRKLHLNYTGGTKAMAVYIYDFFRTKYNDKFESSYLDARTKKMVICKYENSMKTEKSDDLREIEEVSIDINTLLDIHLYRINDIGKSWIEYFGDENYKNIIELLQEILNETEKRKIFLEFVDNLRKIYKPNNEFKFAPKEFYKVNSDESGQDKNSDGTPELKEEIKKEIEEINKQIENNEFLKKILYSFPEDKRIIDDYGKFYIPTYEMSKSKLEKKVKKTLEFLDGDWLEIYVYNKLMNKIDRSKFEERKNFGLSLKAERTREFELDIFILRGYQLVGISITSSNNIGLCKHKGFEVIHRVNQIGGEESKAILITAISDKAKIEELKEDLEYETGSSDGKIKIFGQEDWEDIDEKIIEEVFAK